jgi:ribonucleoside-diphosphate reductase alpha chain
MVTTRKALEAVAVGKGGKYGLNLERWFTTEGVHPYDEIEWELRDAVIHDFKTGGLAFEQRGVEFPVSWSMNATTIVAQKYFRGPLGSPEREHSVRQMIDRVADTITARGRTDGYFADEDSAEIFNAELKHLLVNQKASFNSPVWFNIGVPGRTPQASACYILSVEDTMSSILNWYVEEGLIFKGGSGAGVNLSRIRSSQEQLRGGGTASGPVSFMRGADASAGTIKSGGTTRRAAKMVILDVDHPDVEEFIWCKQREEVKARALRDAGFDMDLDGTDSASVQYQNANNSVRVTDEFMQAVLEGRDFDLKAVTTGDALKTVRAPDLMRQIAQAAWECADPGVQYDTTINDWHTTPNAGRINGSNPCFPGDARVHTDKGLIAFEELLDRVRDGETFGVYTHGATNPDEPAERMELTSPDAFMITGRNPVVKLRFSNGGELRCTPSHKIFTTNRGYVAAEDLAPEDRIKAVDLPTPAISADRALLPLDDVLWHRAKGEWSRSLALPEKWTEDLAHYLGWLVGEGGIAGNVITSVYGNGEDQEHVLPRHRALITEINDGREPRPCEQSNGTQQLRQSRRIVAEFFRDLGVTGSSAGDKSVPWSVEQAPPDAVAAFLRGLFDAVGCVYDGANSRDVGLGSVSQELLLGVQRLLSTFGIVSRIYRTKAGQAALCHTRADGTSASCTGTNDLYDLRISGRSVQAFAAHIGFTLPRKAEKLRTALVAHAQHHSDQTLRLVERTDDGIELTYNLSEPRNHSYCVEGVVVRNCSEYMHLDNSACNLASLNLRKFESGGVFDVESFRRAVEIVFTAQEILVGNSSYPTDKIAQNARAYRQLGLGYANLGGLLMSQGIPYDSEEGRAWAAAITALMTGHAYRTSAELARVQGPFDGFAADREGTLRVIAKHKAAADEIDPQLVPATILQAAGQAWADALELGTAHGIRNAQATVLAPTGCLVGGSLVPTEEGLVRLASLGDQTGEQWQDLDLAVATDEGPRQATKFYVNGLESVVTIETARGYRIQGTPRHRIKVVDADGRWAWKRFSDITEGDAVPLSLNQLVGRPRAVAAPALQPARGEAHVQVPATISPVLAELAGLFAAAGAADAAGLRFTLDAGRFDVAERLSRLVKGLFNVAAHAEAAGGRIHLSVESTGLARWWADCGFTGRRSPRDRAQPGSVPHLPDAVLATNDRLTYLAYVRGLFAAAGLLDRGRPAWETTDRAFARDAQTLLLALGYPTIRRAVESGHRLVVEGPLDRWDDEVGVSSDQAAAATDPSGAFLIDRVASAKLGDDQYTYDLSVPDNVTYIANGFVSHNTIGLMMDCDTTGIEPDLGLVKGKKLVGGGTMRIVNRTVPVALERLGYQTEQIEAIVAYIDEHGAIEGAPAFREEHLPVFDCAMGSRSIAPMGHVKMMAAVQPFISGAISKTINTPESATVEDVEHIYIEGWKLGLKALAIYRDNCKVAQPLSIDKKKPEAAAATDEEAAKYGMVRRRLPKQRPSQTISFQVGDAEGYLTAGEYPGDGLGEIFVKLGKQGSTLSGVMDAFAISVSLGLQYGVPLEAYVKKFTNMRFEPAGMTDDPEVKFASSIVDYIFRRLAIEYLPAEKRHELGIYTLEERNAQLDAGYPPAVSAPQPEAAVDPEGQTVLPIEHPNPVDDVHGDAPMCYQCGVTMIRAGSCHCCPQCGTTSGCS